LRRFDEATERARADVREGLAERAKVNADVTCSAAEDSVVMTRGAVDRVAA
jgi:hypothetical protein